MVQNEERIERNIKKLEDKISELMEEKAPEKKIKALVDEQGNQMKILAMLKDTKELAREQSGYTQ